MSMPMPPDRFTGHIVIEPWNGSKWIWYPPR
jgi:hypothetical protein